MGLFEGKAILESQELGISASCLNPGNSQVDADWVAGRNRAGTMEPVISEDDIGRMALLMAILSPEASKLETVVLPISQKYIRQG